MAKRITDEKLNVEMSINGVNKTQAEISSIQKSIRGLKSANEDLAIAKRKLVAEGKRESDLYRSLTKEQEKNRAEIDVYTKKQAALQKQLGLTGLTMGQLDKKSKSLKAQMKQFVPNTPEWNKLNNELKETDRRLDSVRKEMRSTGGVMGSMKKSFGGFGAMFFAGFSVTAAIQGVKKLVSVNAELSESQANVQKTTGLSEKQVASLTRTLKKLDTRTPVGELLALSEEAGRLGKKSVQDILGFVKTADMIKVALGDDLQGDINENVQLIGKLSTQYKVADKYGGDFGKGMERVGSAINEVAASGSNQADFLVDYLKRLVGISSQANISADDQLGYAAALDESAQSVEVSGTTMSKVITDMYSNASEYAKIAGVDTEEFTKLLAEDGNEALLLFLEGLNGNGEGLSQMTKKLDSLKLEGSRSISVLTALASNTDNIRAKQEIANKAIREATSLTQEFNVKNGNLAGNLEKIGNSIGNYFKNSAFTGWLTKVTSGLVDLNRETNAQSNLLREQQFETNVLVGSITSLNEGNDARDRLIKELQKSYPDFLANLDEEKVTNSQLKDRLVEVNAQYREKIKLAALGELMAENESEAVKLQREELDRIKNIEKLSTTLNVTKGKTLEQTLENAKAEGKYAVTFDKDYTRIIKIRERLNELQKENIDLQKKSKSVVVPGEETPSGTKPETENPESTEINEEELKKQQQERERQAKEAKSREEQRLRELDSLEEQYQKQKEDRLAKGYVAKAELEKQRALTTAENLKAEQSLLDEITAEHDIKIQEAKTLQEEEELKRFESFKEKKQALEDEIALQKAETDLEKEILSEELKYERDQEKFERELEDLQLKEEEKNILIQLLTTAHESALAEIKDKFAKKQIVADREVYENKKKLLNDSLDASIKAVGAETKLGQGLLLIKQIFAAKEMAIELGLFTAKTSMAAAEAGVDAGKGAMKSAAAAPFPANIPLIIGFAASIAGILTTIKSVTAKGKASVKGFEDGLYSNITRTDGRRFNAKNMGRTSTQIVNEPSYFSDGGGYLAGEAGAELIVDNATFRNLDPKVVEHILSVRNNVRGFETGKYPEATSAATPQSDAEMKALLAGVFNLLQNPPSPNIVWGYDQVEKNNELQEDIIKSKSNGKITP